MAVPTGCPCGKDARVNVAGDRCERCGFRLVEGTWKGVCVTCGREVEKLYGLFVPHLCEVCEQAQVATERRTGRVCGGCRNVYLYCAC